MIIQSGYSVVVRRAVEHLPYLLQEALSIELSRADKCVFTEENVLATESSIEAIELKLVSFNILTY